MSRNRVLVLGGTGFVGSHIVDVLRDNNYNVIVAGKLDVNLLYYPVTKTYLNCIRPHYLINCAALSGGIIWNATHAKEIFHDNTLMMLNVLTAADELKIPKTVNILSSCAYPDQAHVIHEEDFWDGLPNETIRFFGLQKRNMMAYSWALSTQSSSLFVNAVLNNLYGPHDTFCKVRSKVVTAMIRRFVEAKAFDFPYTICFGTGKPTRQFTYIRDAAVGVMKVMEQYSDCTSPINITTYEETSIRELAEAVAELVGYRGEIRWETDRPDGQLRKSMSGEKAERLLEFKATTKLKDGLRETLDWYLQNRELANNS